MRIRVDKVLQDIAGPVSVDFQSAVGSARARWTSKTVRPVSGREYDVELDIDSPITIEPLQFIAPSISRRDDVIVLHVIVEGMDEDGLAYVRLSSDCLVMVDSIGTASVGDHVEIVVPAASTAVTPIGV